MKNSTLSTKLHTITLNKVEINSLVSINTQLISEILPLINKEITSLRDSNDTYKLAKKQTLAKLLKTKLDSKEPVINTALNLIILGLNVDNTIALSKINQIISLFNKKILTKAFINKATKEKLVSKLSELNKIDKLSQAEKLVKKSNTKVAANTTKQAKKVA